MKKFLLMSVLALLSTLTFAAQPTGEDAKAMVMQQANSIAEKLNHNFNLYKSDPKAFNRLVSSEVLPYMDFSLMSQIVLGRTWVNASEAQRKAFTNAFRDALVGQYSQGWSQYVEPPIKESDFKILGTPKLDKFNRADVHVQVRGKGGQQAHVIFYLSFKHGQWKMYDVSFQNVSILRSYRNTFDGRNIDDLIKQLQAGKLQ